MRVRDAVEADGERLGELADAPAEVMRNVVHDRTVRVAENDAPGGSQSGDDDGTTEADSEDAETDGKGAETDEGAKVEGFVGFDAMPGTVRVTYLCGTREARERLLEEPVRFARKEGMSVEALVPEGEDETRDVVEEAGFRRVGTGPRFDGGKTLEYRLDPSTRSSSTRR